MQASAGRELRRIRGALRVTGLVTGCARGCFIAWSASSTSPAVVDPFPL